MSLGMGPFIFRSIITQHGGKTGGEKCSWERGDTLVHCAPSHP
jgi:hypothetical protein